MANKGDTLHYSCKLVEGQFLAYEDGALYDLYKNKFVKSHNLNGYLEYNVKLRDGRQFRRKAHQIVGQLFVDNPDRENYRMINHKDGDKTNNHCSNLEWCDAYINNKHARDTGLNNVSQSNSERWKDPEFRKKTSERFSKRLKESGIVAGKNNPRFKYLVKDSTGKEYMRQDLVSYLGYAQSTVDIWIRKAANGESVPVFENNGITVTDIQDKVN